MGKLSMALVGLILLACCGDKEATNGKQSHKKTENGKHGGKCSCPQFESEHDPNDPTMCVFYCEQFDEDGCISRGGEFRTAHHDSPAGYCVDSQCYDCFAGFGENGYRPRLKEKLNKAAAGPPVAFTASINPKPILSRIVEFDVPTGGRIKAKVFLIERKASGKVAGRIMGLGYEIDDDPAHPVPVDHSVPSKYVKPVTDHEFRVNLGSVVFHVLTT